MTMITRGPIHIMALTVETRPMQIRAPTMRPPDVAEDMMTGNDRNVDLAGELDRSACCRETRR